MSTTETKPFNPAKCLDSPRPSPPTSQKPTGDPAFVARRLGVIARRTREIAHEGE